MTHPNISVIVPSLNGKKVIGNLIKSVEKQIFTGKIEIIVTDDGSTDGTTAYLKRIFPEVQVIRFDKNRGSAPAINAAAKIAVYEYLLVTNDDVVFEKNALRHLLNCAQTQPKAGIVTGKMLDIKGKFAIPGFRINHFLGYHPYDLTNKNKIRECDWAVGACLLIKKRLLKKVGYFDEGYIFCGEEYDLSWQMRRLGLKILYTPKAKFFHGFRRSSIPNQELRFAHYRGKFRYLFKNGRLDHILVFLVFQLLIIPLFYLFYERRSNIKPIYKAFVWNLVNLKKILKSRQETALIIKKSNAQTIS